MAHSEVHQWINVVQKMMNDTYREHIVEIALSHIPHSSFELSSFAIAHLSEYVRIPGFRPNWVGIAPLSKSTIHVANSMNRNNYVATAVICLWADSKSTLLKQIINAAAATELYLSPDWGWIDAREGFLFFDDMPELWELIDNLAKGRSERDQDDFKLGMLWLSTGYKILKNEKFPKVDSFVPDKVTNEIEATSNLPTKTIDKSGMATNILDSNKNNIMVTQVDHTELYRDKIQSVPEWSKVISDIKDKYEIAESYYQTVLVITSQLLDYIKDSNYEQSASFYAELGTNLNEWRVHRIQLKTLLDTVFTQLTVNLEVRSDLKYEMGNLSEPELLTNIDLAPVVNYVINKIERIIDYDKNKQDLEQQLAEIVTITEKLEADLLLWLDKENEKVNRTKRSRVLSFDKVTRKGLYEAVKDAQIHHTNLASQLQVQSTNNTEYINQALKECSELSIPFEQMQLLGIITKDISEEWKNWPIQRRKKLLVDLQTLISDYRVQQQTKVLSELASRLSSEWNEDVLIQLLSALTNEKLDFEALMLLLSANNVHPSTDTRILPKDVVDVLFSGLGKLAVDSDIPRLLNSDALKFAAGWKTEDTQSRLKLCLYFLLANYSTPQPLPNGFLWTIENEWPLPEMANWTKLWQLVRDGNTPVLDTTDQLSVLTKELEQKRQQVRQIFERETTGAFTRARRIQDRKYRGLLNNHILPELEQNLNQLVKLDAELKNAPEYQLDVLKQTLESVYNQINLIDINEYVDGLFKDALEKAALTNYHPFHGRNTISNARDGFIAIIAYAEALYNSWNYRTVYANNIRLLELQRELGSVFPEGTQEFALVKILAQAINMAKDQSSQTLVSNDENNIEIELLSREIYARRIPRVVKGLTCEKFDWSRILKWLLSDLANPTDTAETAAQILLDGEAYNHILLLGMNVSLEKQKLANSGSSEQSRAIDRLTTELIQAGGIPIPIEKDQELGRWKLIKSNIQEQQAVLQAQQFKQKRKLNERTVSLRRKIHNLDDQIFEFRSAMEPEAYELLQSYLESARRMSSNPSNLVDIETIINDIEYRITHRSWRASDLKEFEDRLATSQTQVVSTRMLQSVEEVLSHMRKGLVESLGLHREDLEPSKLETRGNLLEDWLFLRDEVTELRGEQLNSTAKSRIQSLYRYFAQMTSMKYASPERGESKYEHPIVYSVYQLEYPRTTALDRLCTLIAIPGRQAAPQHLAEIEELILQNRWLDHDNFIILFVPAYKKQIDRRFSKYNGIVIIDSETLLDLVLAERRVPNPLACLRSLMLNAKGGNIDVFTVNQLVHSRTAIFVGRDALVSRITTSGQNYVIYGGRRIGKSSMLQEIKQKLQGAGIKVVYHSFEGEDCSDNASARKLARLLQLDQKVSSIEDLKPAIQQFLDDQPTLKIALLLDEIDAYIHHNTKRHVLIQTLRALSEQYRERFRVIVAGFMKLHDCIKGRGARPFTPSSDPWTRIFNNVQEPLGNLNSSQAEAIVRVGFQEILGWSFETYLISQLIVKKTGGHPAFVQFFCMKVQKRVANRGNKIVQINDIDAVFDDESPSDSFIAHVKDTLTMNIEDPFGRYMLLFLAADNKDANRFVFAQAQECAELFSPLVSLDRLQNNLDRLAVTSVIKEIRSGIYEFTVPDYPLILNRLGDTAHMNELERQIQKR